MAESNAPVQLMMIMILFHDVILGTSLEEVRTMFSEHVPVKYINLPRNEESGEIKGFAFIDVESADDIPKAVEALNGKQVGERPLRVSKVLEKDQIRSKKQGRKFFSV